MNHYAFRIISRHQLSHIHIIRRQSASRPERFAQQDEATSSEMRVPAAFSILCAALAAQAAPQSAEIHVQALSSSASAPLLLAEISYDLASLGSSSVISYDAPDIPESSKHIRIGVYDRSTKTWTSGTTLASTENFAKGYSPTIIVNVDSRGDVLSASIKGVQIDAGQTRDFGPKVLVLTEGKGAQPVLNKPVVLMEGKQVEVEEKTFLQKYVSPALAQHLAYDCTWDGRTCVIRRLTFLTDTGG